MDSDELGPQVDAVLDEHMPDSAGWLLLVWRDGGLTVLGTAAASGHVPELLADALLAWRDGEEASRGRALVRLNDALQAWREAEGAPGSLQ